MTRSPYSDAFYGRRHAASRRSASAVLAVLDAVGVPLGESALDVGCGRGAWLEAVADRGSDRLVGIDGPWNAEHFRSVEGIRFAPVELANADGATLRSALGDQRFDLGISVEVLEHLPQSAGDAVIEVLADRARVVVFSAAVPGQGGTGHVNERWQSHWAERFARHGLLPYDVVRPVLWGDDDVDFWYRQNVLVYAAPGVLPDLTPADPGFLDLVHPLQLAHGRTALSAGEALAVLGARARERAGTVAKRALRR